MLVLVLGQVYSVYVLSPLNFCLPFLLCPCLVCVQSSVSQSCFSVYLSVSMSYLCFCCHVQFIYESVACSVSSCFILIVPCLLLCWYSGKATHTFGAMSAAQTQAFRCMLYCECDKKNELKVHYVQFCFPCLFSQIQFSCALQVSPLCPFAFVYLNPLYCLLHHPSCFSCVVLCFTCPGSVLTWLSVYLSSLQVTNNKS